MKRLGFRVGRAGDGHETAPDAHDLPCLAGAPEWCKLVQMDARRRQKAEPRGTTRASVSFPSEVYEEIARLAAAKKVSVAWVVREAAEHYVAEQWPLFERNQREGTS